MGGLFGLLGLLGLGLLGLGGLVAFGTDAFAGALASDAVAEPLALAGAASDAGCCSPKLGRLEAAPSAETKGLLWEADALLVEPTGCSMERKDGVQPFGGWSGGFGPEGTGLAFALGGSFGVSTSSEEGDGSRFNAGSTPKGFASSDGGSVFSKKADLFRLGWGPREVL